MLGQLALNNPPSVKQFHEAIAATLLLRHTGLLQQHLLPLLVDLTKSSPFTGSLMLVAVQTALHSPAAARDELLPALLKLLLPWCNIHNHNVRTFAQLGVSALLDAAPLDTWPRWREALGQGGADVAAHMVRFLAENADFQRFKRGIGEGMAGWSPVDVTHPRRIFSSQLHLAGAFALACMPQPQLRLRCSLRRHASHDRVPGLSGCMHAQSHFCCLTCLLPSSRR